MDYKAGHRFADMSARKIRPFAQLVRGRPADEALEMLRYLHNKGARLLEQLTVERPHETTKPAALVCAAGSAVLQGRSLTGRASE